MSSDIIEAAQELRFREVLVISLTTAISLTMALYWKDLIMRLVEVFIPANGGRLFWKFFTAIIITILGILAIYALLKSVSPTEHEKG